MFQADSGGPLQFVCSSGIANCELRADVSGMVYARARLGGSGWLLQAQRRLDVTRARLVVVADKPHAGRGRDVRFTVGSIGGRPFTVQNWHPSAAGDIRDGCVPGSATCKWRLADSLWMIVTGTVNGLQRRDSVRVLAVACPTDDPVLDHPGVRELLRALEARTDSSGLEHSGYVIRRPDGTYYLDFRPVSGNTCTQSFGPPHPSSPDSVMFVAHTHLYFLRQTTCDSGVYRPGPGGIIPSIQDWRRASNDAVPHIVMDKGLVARVSPLPMQLLEEIVYNWRNPETGQRGTYRGPSQQTIDANSKQVQRQGNQCYYP
jgi:hypothetical protein